MSDLPERVVDETGVIHAVMGGTDQVLVTYCTEVIAREKTLTTDNITCLQCLVEDETDDMRILRYDGIVHLAKSGDTIDINEFDYNASFSFLVGLEGPAYVLRRRDGTSYDEIGLRCGRWAPYPTNTKQTDPITCLSCLKNH